MTIYVDDLFSALWTKRYASTQWCHMATDNLDLEKLHQFAERIGLKRSWFQTHPKVPHYDITASKRAIAIQLGAKPVSAKELFRLCKKELKHEQR